MANVTRPVQVGYFPRRRLYSLLDKSRKVPVLWITGPPGCGKTALVSSYIESRRLSCLWYKVDDADGDLAHHSFTVALSRLRKLLGREEALLLRESRLSLSNRHCWVDVWAFERFLRQAEKARKEASCRRTLSSVLGVDPSAETRVIAASLGRSPA